jgi:S-methylmethionine-dependent homocysteine/selenocysteine methylase
MGQELIRRSPDDVTWLWGAVVMRDHPHLVQGLHEDFLRAGARVLTLNTYSLTRPRLALKDADELFEPMQRAAGELAVAALDGTGADAILAGGLPPLVGSYSPDSVLPVEEAARHFAEIVAHQADYVDLFICETMSSIQEAQGALAGAATAGKPIWLAFTTTDEDGTILRSGETLADAVEAVRDAPHLAAILVNCARPEAAAESMPILATGGLPFGAYANGFTKIVSSYKPGSTVSELETRTDLTPEAYADFAMAWVEAGATIIGGCCEVGPAHIAHIAQRLEAAGHTIVKDLTHG